MTGDLLEPGEWSRIHSTAPLEEAPTGTPTSIVRAYLALMPSLFGCFRGACGDVSGILEFCLLPAGHEDWPGGVLNRIDGKRHRMYRVSARDSAAMLAGMRRKLEQP